MKLPPFAKALLTGLGGLVSVTVRKGSNKGLKWTLYPYSAYWRGEAEERDTVSAITTYIREGSVCYDLGAHFGFYSLMMAVTAGHSGSVFAFEPEPTSFKRLARHIALNGLGKRCHAFNVASSSTETIGAMASGVGGGATTTHFRYEDETDFDGKNTIKVRTVRIDSLFAQGTLKAPDFVKIDVEGHAGQALEGMRDTIDISRPVVLLSTHGAQERCAIDSFFAPRGYRGVRSLTGEVWGHRVPRAGEGVIMLP